MVSKVLDSKVQGFVAQAFKTALAGALALFLAGLFALPEPYWASISAIIVMQSDLAGLATAAGNRMLGTAIGALVGACIVALFGTGLPSFALGVFLAILACGLVGYWETYRFAGVTVAIVMLVTRQDPPWRVGLHRFLEVSFGIGMAYAVAFLAVQLFPPKKQRSRSTRK